MNIEKIKDDKTYTSNEEINQRLSEVLRTILLHEKIELIERKENGWQFKIIDE
ncbi:hypothetical protein [Vibrio sp. MEBiC08052]|uniref:hypothetical protein n=1 Tax=Vibrio sp. MEBiC08052 TaxID=1761910 RepID=UPI0007406EB4|nr:hypothetical protein [Vibrio sp. MEBiC08052]KUI98151.1 hypothetical protein VRK_28520 [Vibrio sp. MEBiC08052]